MAGSKRGAALKMSRPKEIYKICKNNGTNSVGQKGDGKEMTRNDEKVW